MNRVDRIKGEKGFHPGRFLAALGLSFLLVLGQTAPLLGNPTGGAVVAGSATIGAAGPTLTINQSTQNAIINWQQFSIAGGELTKFVVPNNSSATLNRVLGGNPSSIYGSLQSNGVLYLVNPSGIVVGPGGRIDTAGFLASTADISNQQFLQGGDLNLNGTGGAIDNEGTIHASMGDVYLIANQVSNTGTISAPRGTVGLAAGTDILFQQSGNQHLFVQATPAGTKRAVGVTNAGTINAAAAELKAAGGNAYALAINNTGVIAASGYKKINGQVYLTADGGSIANSGRISARTAQGNGGTIVVDGTAVASPTSGAVTNSGTLDASATVAGGKGGSVTLKNMGGKTVDSGKIIAQGGTGGAGGNAEISGAELGFTGTVDLTALHGQVGNLLLDPTTLNIVTGGGSNLNGSTVDPGAIVGALDGGDVTLQATTSITVSDLVDASANGSPGNLTLMTPTLNLNAGIVLEGSSALSGTATTVNVGAGGRVQNAVDASSTTSTPVINLAAGATYELTSEIRIGKSLTLDGNGAILDGSNGAGAGNGVIRVMEIDGTTTGILVALNDVTLENGNGSGGNESGYGGALLVYSESYNQSAVTLNNCTISGSSVYYYGGGIYNDGYYYGNAALTLNDCTISDNTALTTYGYGQGGGIYSTGYYNGSATLTLNTNSTFSGNSGSYGKDVYNYYGNLDLVSPGNTTATIGASIYSTGSTAVITVAPTLTTLNVNGPVVSVSGATLTSSATTVNVGAPSGAESGYLVQGGVDLAGDGGTVNLTAGTYELDGTTGEITIAKSLTLNGNGAILDGSNGAGAGNGVTRVMEIDGNSAGVTVNVNGLTLENGNGNGSNDSGDGGALLVYSENHNLATVTLNNCTISGSSVNYYGGGIYNDGYYYGNAALTLNNCTVTGNTVLSIYGYGYGGGIYNNGTYNGNATLTITNSTITGNSGYYNGGIYNAGTITNPIDQSLVFGNVSADTNPTNVGADFYNVGVGTYTFIPDTAGSHTSTVNGSIYSSGSGAVLTVDPSVTNLIVNAPVTSTSNAVVNTATTALTIGPGSGTENGYLIQSGLTLAPGAATLNLTAGITYNFDGTTSGLSLSQSLTLEGNGAVLNGQGSGVTLVTLNNGADTVTFNNLTVENGNTGINSSYYNSMAGVTLNLNHVTITGNAGTGFYNSNYYGYANTVNLTDCMISNNSGTSTSAGGIYNSYSGTLNLTNCTISGNGSATNPPNAGGIYNSGTLTLDSATTVTGNTGYYAGGIENNGTIIGTVNSSQVHGNTESSTSLANAGADFYNTGTATFAYNPDGEANHTLTITQPIYSSGSGSVITIDPTILTLNVNADINSTSGATFNSSATTVNVNAPVQTDSGVFNSAATTVNVAAGSGTENGYLVEGGVALAGSGATVNLAAGTTYNFDGSTAGLSIAQNLTLAGNGATLNAQDSGVNVISLNTGADTVAINNLTVENGSTGIYAYYYYNAAGGTLELNNVTSTGNSNTGLYYTNYYGYANSVSLTNCTISNNDSGYGSGGIYNAYGTMSLTNCTISGNGNLSNPASAGGIYNIGTLTLDNATTITGNTGYYAGGIENNGTIIGTVNSSQVHGNTETSTSVANVGADFYNTGTATFAYNPDGEANHTLTITQPIYSSGSGSVITIDPTIQTLNVNADVNSTSGATFNSSATTVNVNAPVQTTGGVFNSAATTVNVAAGSGTENGYFVEGGVALAGSGATVNLAAGTTYNFDGTTGGLSIAQNLTLAGNGATLDAQDSGVNVISLNTGADTVTINNLTVENGSTGVDAYYYNPNGGVTLNLNNVTITGNSSNGFYNANYYGYANTAALTNCTISDNDTTGGNAGGIYNTSGTLTLTNCAISNNGNAAYASTGGGIVNGGTIDLDSATTITGNTGYYAGGIYNYGTIIGTVNSSQVHGNTETSTSVANVGADFYNTGTATFAYNPDGEVNHTLTITQPIYSSGSGSVITIDPTIQTLNVNADINSTSGATFNSSATTVNINAPVQTSGGVFNSAATTVNVAAGSGTENGYLVEGGVTLAGSGATVNLAAGTTYNFDGTTGGLSIAQNLTLAGNGATLNAQDSGVTVVNLATGADTVTINNLTVENGSTGVDAYYYNPNGGVTLNLNNVTITGNTNSGLYDLNYSGNAETANLTNCVINNNATDYGAAGGIYNVDGTFNLINCTISGNGNAANPPTAGGIYNDGTLTLDSATTITGNTGYYAGGIYNYGTIVGTVNSSQVQGNTETSTDLANAGADFYNTGAATFVYKPDGEANHTLTITQPIYSSSSGAVITIDPSIQTLNINTDITSSNGATFNSTAATVNINSPMQISGGVFNSAATTVNVAAGSGTDNGYLIQAGFALAGSGATVNLTADTTYSLDGTTGGLSFGQSLTLAGNGATLNGQGTGVTLLTLNNGAGTVVINNLTVENGSTGISTINDNSAGTVSLTLNNVAITGNTYTGLYTANYSGSTDTVDLTNCAITGNGNYYASAGGIYNVGTTMTLTNCTVSNNGTATYLATAGGIYNDGGILNLNQTTISGNQGEVGGIYNNGACTATDCSISGNFTGATPYDVDNNGTYTFIADGNAGVPNTINYSTADYNSGTATYEATTINWNVPFTNHGTLTIDPVGGGSVTINSPITNSGGLLLIQAPVITLNAAITSTYGDIVLNDSSRFINNVGSGALSATNGYVWQVWSVNPPTSGQGTVDNDGGLVPDFIQYNATYGVTAPAGYGNGLLYSYAPVLSVNLTGPYTKTYDGTPDVTIPANSYTAAGLVSGDSLSATGALDATFNTKDVDTATTVTVTASTLTSSVNQGGIPVYGYTAGTSTAPGTITPAPVTAGLTGTVSKVYDTTTAATLTSSNYSLSGAVSGDTVNLNDPATGTYQTANVGTNIPVTVSGLALSGADADDYSLAATTISAPIGTITAAGLNAVLGYLTGTVSKVYDGTLSVGNLTAANYALSGVMGNDNVVLTGPATGTYASPNAGTGIMVTSSTGLVLSGAQAGNYYLTNTQASGPIGIITQAPLTLTTSPVTKTYDGSDTASGSTIITSGVLYTNAFTGVPDTLGAGTYTFTNPNAGIGNKTVAVSGVTVNDGNGGGNYAITYANNTTSTINPAALTISTSNVIKTYDGTDTAAGAATVTAGTLYLNAVTGMQDSLSGGTFTFTNPNAGLHDKTVTVAGVTVNDGNAGGNYTVSYASNTTSTINQAALTISAGPVTKTYDGTDAASGTLTLTAGTLYTNAVTGVPDSLSGGTLAFTNPNAGAGDKMVAVSGVTVNDGNGGGNYAITYANNTTSTINPAALTISTSNVTKTYDGTDTAAGTPIVTSGTLYLNVGTGVPDSLSGGTFAFTDPNAGAGDKTVTVGGVTVNDGNGGGNYTVTYASNTTSTINPATLTYLADTLTIPYQSSPPSTYDGSVTGLVNGDSLTAVTTGTAVFNCTATSSSDAGSYAITGSGLMVSSPNYDATIAQAMGNYTALTILAPVTMTTSTTTPSTATGGADGGGSNIVPAALTPPPVVFTQNQNSPATPTPPPAPGTAPADNAASADAAPVAPPPISLVGSGVAVQVGQQSTGLANSSSNSGQVSGGDVAQLGNGQLNNVANPHASGALNQALGPAVFHTLQDALQQAGDFGDAAGTGTDTDTASTDPTANSPRTGKAAPDDETILTGGDVAEVAGGGAKKIPLSQAPPQLQRALAGDVLQGLGAGH